ncbi:MAG: SDR family oxidoreductase [Ignavibacteria bacterium]|nr:SDR family oxidoreductase [Ignavibacteria bacterium]
MKSVLIIGSKGMLGCAMTRFFKRAGHDVKAISREEFDIAKDPITKLEEFVPTTGYVINCAGVIKPQIAKMSIEDVLRVNSIFPRNLAKLAEEAGALCFHVTTDCVYSGKKGRYQEDDFFDAEDVYGMTKNAGETNEMMTLRTSIIGEEFGQSRSLLEWVRSSAGKTVNGFTNHQWNGVTTVYLADIIHRLIMNDAYRPGIFHIHSPNTVTKMELVNQISEVYNLNVQVTPVEAAEACDRSLASKYQLTKEYATDTILEQLYRMKEFFAG